MLEHGRQANRCSHGRHKQQACLCCHVVAFGDSKGMSRHAYSSKWEYWAWQGCKQVLLNRHMRCWDTVDVQAGAFKQACACWHRVGGTVLQRAGERACPGHHVAILRQGLCMSRWACTSKWQRWDTASVLCRSVVTLGYNTSTNRYAMPMYGRGYSNMQIGVPAWLHGDTQGHSRHEYVCPCHHLAVLGRDRCALTAT